MAAKKKAKTKKGSLANGAKKSRATPAKPRTKKSNVVLALSGGKGG